MNSLKAADPLTSTSTHMEEALTVLRRLPVFRHTSLETIKLYAYLSRKEQYSAREIILRQGTACDGVRLIIRGEVLISHTAEERTIRLQALSGDHLNYFGELALISEFDWFFNAHAVTDVEVLMISRNAFKKVMERFPENYMDVVAKIVRLRVNRFNHQTDYLINNMGEEALNNLAADIPLETLHR